MKTKVLVLAILLMSALALSARADEGRAFSPGDTPNAQDARPSNLEPAQTEVTRDDQHPLGWPSSAPEPAKSQSPVWPSLVVLGIMVILRFKLRHHWETTRGADR